MFRTLFTAASVLVISLPLAYAETAQEKTTPKVEKNTKQKQTSNFEWTAPGNREEAVQR